MTSNGASKPFPDEEGQLIYDFCFDQETMEWVPWMSTVAPYRCDGGERKNPEMSEPFTFTSSVCDPFI